MWIHEFGSVQRNLKINGQGVDGEVPPSEVLLDTPALQRRHVQPEFSIITIQEDPAHVARLIEREEAPAQQIAQLTGQGNGTLGYGQVQILRVPADEAIPQKPPDEEGSERPRGEEPTRLGQNS